MKFTFLLTYKNWEPKEHQHMATTEQLWNIKTTFITHIHSFIHSFIIGKWNALWYNYKTDENQRNIFLKSINMLISKKVRTMVKKEAMDERNMRLSYEIIIYIYIYMHIYINIICLGCTLPIVAIQNSKIPICQWHAICQKEISHVQNTTKKIISIKL